MVRGMTEKELNEKLKHAVAVMRKLKIPLQVEQRKWKRLMKTKAWTLPQQQKFRQRKDAR